ncbi:putative dehydrogenase [Rhizobium leguminosarum bv. trifolii WSM597]|uniref:Putative dehydrogenase n=1 Tax=Rhizobium leguminosarum bv. trifolii WSM597 TaxID=754764 RepID=I9N631_RHILT|nr:glycosyltransferase [Rhizobium leguminosarum]EJB02157.1 putative dehydrogenase [Rhizobium leguminosarum bv. trifolii WSM597]
MIRKRHVTLATDSFNPSGMGEHMLALGRGLSEFWNVTVAVTSDDRTGLLARAARCGLAIKLIRDTDEFQEWLSRSRVDILHVHAGIGWEGHDLAAAADARGIPIIRTEHLPYLLNDPEQIECYRRETERLAHLIVVSEASRQSFREARVASSRLTVVRNGIFPLLPVRSATDFSEGLGLVGKTVLLTVARFTEQKDQASLVRALPAVLQDNPSVVLLLVGTGPEEERVKALVTELELTDYVQFLGQRDDVADIMAIANLFVLPSQFEGLPLAVLEAMSLAVPVIATRIGGTLEALGDDHPYFTQPGSPAEIAAVINRALADPGRLAASGRAGLERFKRDFSVVRMAAETATVYERFLNQPRNQTQKDRSMEKTRLGFIGVGGIAHRHLGVLASFDDVELAAFADLDLGRADEAAMRFGARSFAHHREMLDTQQLDAVYICIPPFAHGEPERDLIQRQIPFFVEKPVSLGLAQAEDIAAGVANANLITAVGYHWRYLDIVDEAKSLLADNPAQLLSGYWLDSTPPPEWWWKEGKSGGQMVEQATHLLDLARWLIGDVTEVYGRASYKDRPEFPGLDVPTVTTASLTFETGVIANIASTCLLGWSHRVGLHIFADRLAIELTDRDIMVDVGRGRPVRTADGDPVWRENRDFIDAVRGGENRIRCPYGDAVATHRLALAVVSSARSGALVHLAPSGIRRPQPGPLQPQPRPPQGLAPGHRKIRSLGVEAPGRAYFFEYEEGMPADGHLRLDTLFTGLSAGTELTFLKHTNPYFRSRFDGGRGVFIEGEPDLHYPIPFLGYMEVARVSQSRAHGFSEGAVLAASYGHKSGHTADPYHDLLVQMPLELDPLLGIFVAQMGPIAANGILHADAETFGANVPALGAGVAGRPVIVLGAGTVGLMTALFARVFGASDVVIADPSDFRREKAEAMGLTAMTEDQAWQHAKARWHDGTMGRGADLAFQTRAHPGSLHTALKALRPQGTVIDLAFYQHGAGALRLGEEFHHNGLNIRCAQINRVPRGLAPLWDRRRLARATVDLLASDGTMIREHIVTHVVPLDEAPSFLADLVENRPEFLQVVFKVGE